MHVQHLAVGLANDHDRARVDTDHVVSQLAGEHRDFAVLASRCRRGAGTRFAGTDHHEVGVLAAQRRGAVVRRGDRIHRRLQAKRRGPNHRMANHPKARSGRRQAGAGECNPIDFGATISAVAGEAQRAAVLRMLPSAHDRHGDRIAVGVLDGLVVDRDAHARSTVANRPFAARLCGESFLGAACETMRMDSLAFHREALDVAQHVIDEIDRSKFDRPTPCDEWNVRQLLEHMIGGNRRIAGNPPADGEDLIGDDLSAAYAASAAGAAATFEAPGGLDRTFNLSFGEVPGELAVVARATDQLAHTWDLAKATGMSTELSPEMYTTALEVLQQRFAKFGRNAVTYNDEQQPPAGAGAADRFAAFAGRRA
jgi:uncharacterized protein (TIGR03086 family)